jgi:isohexenylglutaconyl-CoA hydratase
MNLPDTPTLLVGVDEGVMQVCINRPETRNAMSAQVVTDLLAVFEDVRSRDGLRALVLRGAGGNFCAGGDIKDMAAARTSVASSHADPVAAFNRRFGTMVEQFDALPVATVAILEGAVLGGGFGLACAADVSIAQEDAKFGLPETGLGILPAQIAPFVVRRIGLSHARRLGLCGARFDGVEALRLGLAHYVEPDTDGLDARLADVLSQILRCGPKANADTKKIMLSVGTVPLCAVLDDAAARFSAALRGPEAAEGTRAFLEKRSPAWAKESR